MLNCYDTCFSNTLKMAADVKEDKHTLLTSMMQKIYNLLESQLEARQDLLGCLKCLAIKIVPMRAIQFILKYHIHLTSRRAFQHSWTLLGLIQLCTGRCVVPLQTRWGVLSVLSCQSRKSQFLCCNYHSSYRSSVSYLVTPWYLGCSWQCQTPTCGQLKWGHQWRLYWHERHWGVGTCIWDILTCVFNLTPALHKASWGNFWPVDNLLKDIDTEPYTVWHL